MFLPEYILDILSYYYCCRFLFFLVFILLTFRKCSKIEGTHDHNNTNEDTASHNVYDSSVISAEIIQ